MVKSLGVTSHLQLNRVNSVNKPTIETERLLLRHLTEADAPALHRTTGDPDVMKRWWPGPDKDVQQTRGRIVEINEHWDTHGFGDWGVIEKESGDLIGFCGLHYISNMPEVNIGCALRGSEWRKGYGTEVMRSVVQYGFDNLTLAEIVGVIMPGNQKSVGLSEKCEFRFWKRFLWEDRDRLAYRITREDVRGSYA